MTRYFITGAGTGVGKTFVTCGLVGALRDAGRSVAALKPVISGYDDSEIGESDSGQILSALGREATSENAAGISPWRFREPLSPDMAAAREEREIDFDALVKWSAATGREADFRLIEGVGGVLVPLTETRTVLDWIAALGCPALLVGGSYLGTLNHTLTALHVLRDAGVEVPAIIVSESEDQPVPLTETVEALERFSAGVPVFGLPRNADAVSLVSGLGWVSARD